MADGDYAYAEALAEAFKIANRVFTTHDQYQQTGEEWAAATEAAAQLAGELGLGPEQKIEAMFAALDIANLRGTRVEQMVEEEVAARRQREAQDQGRWN